MSSRFRQALRRLYASAYFRGTPLVGFLAAALFGVSFALVTGVANAHVNWEAYVAIGTIALAIATVVAVWAPIAIETKRIERIERRRSDRAIVVATALRDEISRVMVTTESIRHCIRLAATSNDNFNWEGFAHLVKSLAVPVTNRAFERIFDLERSTAQFVQGTRTNVLLLKGMVRLYRHDYSQLKDVLMPLLLLAVQLQQHVTPAFANILLTLESKKPTIDDRYFPSKFELAYAAWVNAGADPKDEPKWPREPPTS